MFNIEFKAKCQDLISAERLLLELQPAYAGLDEQTDTYFNVPHGRLKIREGNIENALIWYKRNNTVNVKRSDILLYRIDNLVELKKILIESLGIMTIINKKRQIYFYHNVKIHFDIVDELGSFIEVEAINDTGFLREEELKAQCIKLKELFNISDYDLVDISYSDMKIKISKND